MKLHFKFNQVLKGAILLGASLPVAFASFSQTAYISHTPEQVEVMVGDTFSVNVNVHIDSEPISVIDVHMIFNNEHLKVVEVSEAEGSAFNYHVPPHFSNSHGKIDMSSFKLGHEPLNGQVEAMKVTFVALSETPLTEVYHPMSAFPKSLLAYNGKNRLGSTSDLIVTILADEALSTDEHNSVSELNAWPNPAQHETAVSFRLEQSGQVTLSVFDNLGRELEKLFEGNASAHTDYRFDLPVGRYASGAYNVRLQMANESKSIKLIVGK